MKPIIPWIALCAIQTVAAQDDFEAKYAAKLEESWLKDGGWIVDFDEAKVAAKESGKPILAYFSRSYSP